MKAGHFFFRVRCRPVQMDACGTGEPVKSWRKCRGGFAVCCVGGEAHSAKLGTHLGRIHDVKTGWVLHAHEGSVRVLLPWPGKPAVATAGVDGRLKLWSTAKEPWSELLSIEAHKGAIYRAVASPDGRWVATASRDKSVAVWDATTLELAARLQGPGMKGHTRSVNALLWTDVDTLISGGDDRRILVWRHTSNPGPETHDARH